jgi:tetratricopeptide (TPR) repeat protein
LLQDAIARLEPISLPGEEWNQVRVLGSAYNLLGYVYALQMRYSKSVELYNRALPYLRQAELGAHLADAEKNLARVYSLLGRHREAVALCDDSIELFHRANNRYGEAYSLNTLGIIRTDMEHFYRGYIHSRDALRIFRRLEYQRGIGLALHALGEAARKRATFEEYTLGQAEKLFREAEGYLQEAQTYLAEPLRLAYARNELGCVHRDRAAVHQRHNRDIAGFIEQARKYLLEAADVAGDAPEWRTHRADCYEDLAEVEFICGPEGYVEALKWLDEAEGNIEPQYRITEQGLPPIEEPVQGYWVMLGKTELLRGHIAFAEGRTKEDAGQDPDPDYQEAIRHYVFATAYFEAFSPQAHELHTTLDSMYDRLRKLSARWLARLRIHAEGVAGSYNLDVTRFMDMFDSTLGAISLLSEEGTL